MDREESVWPLQDTRLSQPCCKFHGLICPAAQGTGNLCYSRLGEGQWNSSLLFTELCRVSTAVILHVFSSFTGSFPPISVPLLSHPLSATPRRAVKDQEVHKGDVWLKKPALFLKCDFLLVESCFLKAVVQNSLRSQFSLIFHLKWNFSLISTH